MNKILSLLLLILIVSCSPEKKENTSDAPAVVESLDPEAFKAKLESVPDAVLLDVRTPEETSQGVIKGAVKIDFKGADFEQQLSSLDKDKTYFVYCGAGGRSSKTANLLKDKGFTKVYNLDGGFTAWKDKGLETASE